MLKRRHDCNAAVVETGHLNAARVLFTKVAVDKRVFRSDLARAAPTRVSGDVDVWAPRVETNVVARRLLDCAGDPQRAALDGDRKTEVAHETFVPRVPVVNWILREKEWGGCGVTISVVACECARHCAP